MAKKESFYSLEKIEKKTFTYPEDAINEILHYGSSPQEPGYSDLMAKFSVFKEHSINVYESFCSDLLNYPDIVSIPVEKRKSYVRMLYGTLRYVKSDSFPNSIIESFYFMKTYLLNHYIEAVKKNRSDVMRKFFSDIADSLQKKIVYIERILLIYSVLANSLKYDVSEVDNNG